MGTELSRRSFLKGAAIAGASAAAVGALAGCSSSGAAAEGATEIAGAEGIGSASYADQVSSTMECDYCVIGSGTCGMTSAIEAAQNGLSVIVLEKRNLLGGTSTVAEEFFALGTHWQEEAGYLDQCQIPDVFNRTCEYSHYKSNADATKAFFTMSKENFDWMEKQGVTFMTVHSHGPSVPSAHVYEGLGEQMIATLTGVAEKAGVQFITEAPAKGLKVEDGVVKGVYAETADGILEVDAKAVMLATGGYTNNPDMMLEYCDIDGSRMAPQGVIGRDGDGINMALIDAGAQLWSSMGVPMCFGPALRQAPFGSQLAVLAGVPALWVNEKGNRFGNEGNHSFSHLGNMMRQQKGVYALVDSAQLEAIVGGAHNGSGRYYLAGDPMDTLMGDIDANMASEQPDLTKVDTLDEAAEWAGIDPEALKETVEHYNELCAAGQDTDYFKESEWLVPVQTGPFYVLELAIGQFTTADGIKINEYAQVIGADDEPIPGLYAGGSDAGGLQGDTYDVGICPGSQQGWSCFCGRTAAQNAALESLFANMAKVQLLKLARR